MRARRLYAPAASAQKPAVWMLALAPGIFDRPEDKNLTSTTLLGPLIPEVGVILDANRARAYIGLSVPYEYRLVPEKAGSTFGETRSYGSLIFNDFDRLGQRRHRQSRSAAQVEIT